MSDRILRCFGLLTSEAWLNTTLSNDARVCWLAAFATVDTFGNMTAGPHRLVHLWRPYRVEQPAQAEAILAELARVDLSRLYAVEGKRYLHIPRFRQSVRWLGRLNPLSPWTTSEEIERLKLNPRAVHLLPLVELARPLHDVDVGVDVDVDAKQHLFVGQKPDDGQGEGKKAEQDKRERLVAEKRERQAAAVRLIGFLNEKTGRKYQAVEANVRLIVARLKEGATETQIRQVIANRCAKWTGTPEMDEYLRPATLFNAIKFAQYVGMLGAKKVESIE